MKTKSSSLFKKIDENIKIPFSFTINSYMDALSNENLEWIENIKFNDDKNINQKLIALSPWILSSYMFPNCSYKYLKCFSKFASYYIIFTEKFKDFDTNFQIEIINILNETNSNQYEENSLVDKFNQFIMDLKKYSSLSWFQNFKLNLKNYNYILNKEILNKIEISNNLENNSILNKNFISSFDPFIDFVELLLDKELSENFKKLDLYYKMRSSINKINILINYIFYLLKEENGILNISENLNYLIISHNKEIEKINEYEFELKNYSNKEEIEIIQQWIQCLKSLIIGYWYWKNEVYNNHSALNEITNLVFSDDSSKRIEPL
jgi:hypothetical protein